MLSRYTARIPRGSALTLPTVPCLFRHRGARLRESPVRNGKIEALMRSSSRLSSPVARVPSSTAPDVVSLDALYREAGLVRNPRDPRRDHTRPPRLERKAPEELAPAPPTSRRAANGVEWLPVPGWDLPWLWAGFSTRKGGLSRAYCVDGAEGELNLGFTEGDARSTVLANRRLLAGALHR